MKSSLLFRSTLVLGAAIALLGAGCGANTPSSPVIPSPTTPSSTSPAPVTTPTLDTPTSTATIPATAATNTPATIPPSNIQSTTTRPTAATPTPPRPTSTQPTATTPPREPAPTAKTYTLEEVATHKDASSCWTVINGKVYDVTAWIARHPGGERGILSLCGKDGTSAFSGQHGGQAGPMSALASFQIGTVN